MATELDKEWRKKEESYWEIIKKYPTVSPFIITQLDVQRRGVVYTDAALDKVDLSIHQVDPCSDRFAPSSLLLRDGTSIVTHFTFSTSKKTANSREPYTVDVVDGKTVLVDDDKVIDEVIYWEKPKFYDKKTSYGTPMREVIDARPQRFSLNVSKYCHFWDKPGEGCKYCGIGANGAKYKGCHNEQVNPEEIKEVMQEIIKQKGRFTGVVLTGGSILSGNELCDDELQAYINAMQAIGTAFKTKKFPSQINSTALNERLHIFLLVKGRTDYTVQLIYLERDMSIQEL